MSIIFLLTFLIPAVLLSACKKEPQIVKIKSGNRPYLGVQVEELSQKMLLNLNLDHGIKVTKVYDDSPAAEAGLEKDDILILLNGRDIESAEELVDIVREQEIGDKVKITYFRAGKEHSTEAIIGETKGRTIKRIYSRRLPREYYIHEDGYAWLGVATENLTDQLREYFAAPEDLGVLVKEVIEESPAREAGLQAGDVIIRVEEKEIENTRDLIRAINYFDPDDVVNITFIRNKEEKTVKVKLGEKKGHGPIHIYGVGPDEIEIDIPEIDIEIPEFEFEIDTQELEQLKERIQDKIEIKAIEIEGKLKELDEKLKDVEIKFRDLNRYII